jgi:hypothetical protein
VNIRHKVLDWSGPSHEVIALRLVLIYYAIEIDSSLFLLGSFGCFPRDFQDVLDVDPSSLFIVGELPYRV